LRNSIDREGVLAMAAPHLASDPVVARGFGVAGPVISNHVRGNEFAVDGGRAVCFRRNWTCRKLFLLNDWARRGTASSICDRGILRADPGQAEPGGHARAAGGGDRLGQSILVWDGTVIESCRRKAGILILRSHTEQQIELLRFMRRRYPQVSWELILSGRGISYAS